MAVITREEILERVKKGEIGFEPGLDALQLQSHSVDLRLGFTFMVPKLWRINKAGRESVNIDYFDKSKKNKEYFDVVELERGQYFDVLPGEYVVFSTLELIRIPKDLMAVLYPRSSVNRRGLSVDLTGVIDAGYEGRLIVPVRNNTASQMIRVYPGERFCQVVFEELDRAVDNARKSRYHRKDVIGGFAREKSQVERGLIISGDIKELKKRYKI